MMNKRKALLFFLICGMSLISCGNNNESNIDEEYTVIWQNDKGEILEIDRHVKEGSIPSFDGDVPTKEGNEQYSYTFSKWEPEVSAIYENTTYTATFTSSINKYTITWKNYNGDVLEIDDDVPYGTMPSFDGATPTKKGNEDTSYVFAGWSPSVNEVTCDATYVATFNERHNHTGNLIPGQDPVLSEDQKTIQYGFYPQTHVNDETLIAQLNTLTPLSTNNWYLFNGEYYTKEKAKVYNNESYTFDDGTPIVNESEYWFKCEEITWLVLNDTSGKYFLLSSKLLDAHNFYEDYDNRTISSKTIYPNNYEHSEIRTWLNEDFYNVAFALNNTYIQETTVSNNASTTDAKKNSYACSDTKDKVYLPSYQDYLNLDYGFDSNATNASFTRECMTTDYARARGAWCNTRDTLSPRLKYNSSYWTRSPSSEYSYCAWNINSGGYLSSYAVDGDNHCVRPCVTINIL